MQQNVGDQNFGNYNFDFNQNPYAGYEQPPTTLGWYQVWQKAITEPSQQTYWQLISPPTSTFSRGFGWIVISTLFSTGVTFILQLLWFAFTDEYFTTGVEFYPNQWRELTLGFLIFSSVAGIFISLIGFLIVAGIIHVVASIMGEEGQFDKLVYGLAMFIAPIGIINSIVQVIPCLGSLIQLFLALYSLLLATFAVKVIYNLDWTRAIIAVVSPIAPFILFFCCVLAAFI